MYSDLFDQLGGRGAGGSGAGGGGRSGTAAEPPEEPPLVSLKAGRVNLEKKSSEDGDDENAAGNDRSYSCTADPARGEIRLVWKETTGQLEWQWYDRRQKKVVDAFVVQNTTEHSLTRVPLSDQGKVHSADRVYVWTSYALTGDRRLEGNAYYRMYWMQDLEVGDEEMIVQKINEYLQDPKKAAPEGSTTAAVAGSRASAGAAASGSAAGGTSTNQVDALSSILENLGMPQTGDSTAAAAASSTGAVAGTTNSSSTGTTGTTNQLTLADLQGAMAGIQAGTSSAAGAAPPGPPLNDVLANAPAIDKLLESDDVVQRLIPLLPEGQQTVADLRENLLSPQMRNTVSALQQALLPDDAGDLSGYASVIANFQLEQEAGQSELARGNPLAAFLECVIASVEKEEEQAAPKDDGEKEEETKQDETKDNDDDDDAEAEDL